MDDNIIENLAIKISANFAAADGVVYLSDTRCSSLRTSQFHILADYIFFPRSNNGNQHAGSSSTASAFYFLNRKWKVAIVCSASQFSLLSLIF